MNTDIRILHLEDAAAEVVLAGHELHRAGLRFSSRHVDNRETFLQELWERPPDLILSDHNLPSFDGLAALALVREWCPDVPFIFVTGGASGQAAAQAFKNGAAGYVLKDHMLSIASTIFASRSAALVVAREITRRAPMEGVSSRMEALREVILDTTLDGVVAIDDQGLVREWNSSVQRILGYSRDDALGRPWDELIVPAGPRATNRDERIQTLVHGTGDPLLRRIETTLRRRDGTAFAVELAISRAPAEAPPSCTVLLRDIGGCSLTEATPGLSGERFRLLVEGVEDYAIFQLDLNGHVVTWNRGAEHLYGYQADEIIGSPFAVFFPAQDNENGLPAAVIGRARDEGKEHDEGWRLRKDGSRFLALSILTALRDEACAVRGFAVVAQDVTAQRQAEEEIWRHNDKLERRVAESIARLDAAKRETDVFSYSVSHELRWPLRHIIRFTESLQNRAAATLDEQSQSDLKMIAEGGRQMARLIDAVLSYTRVSQVELQPGEVCLKSLVDQARTLLSRESEGRRIEWHIGELPEVTCDAALLQQAMGELLSNALKFTRTRATAEIHVGAKTESHETVVFVCDNGVGFDMQYVGRLFNVFQRLHPTAQFEGAGIGLANVRRIINRHRGRTWAEGTVDGGATFFFSLPNPPDAAT